MRVRTPLAEISPRLLAGVDARGRRRLLVSLRAEEAPLSDTRSRGLSVQTMELSIGAACCDARGLRPGSRSTGAF